MSEKRGEVSNNNPERARQRARDLERVEDKLRLKKAYSEGEIGQLEYAQRRARARSKGKFVLDTPESRARASAFDKVKRAIRATKRKAAPRVVHRIKPKTSDPKGDDDDDDEGLSEAMKGLSTGGNRTRRKRGRSTRAKHPR